MSKKVEPPKIEKEKLLIVEGDDENRIFQKIFKELEITALQVIPHGGKNALPRYLNNVFIKDPMFIKGEISSVGIIRDANSNANAAFESVCSALENSGLDKPLRENEKTGGNPAISVLILPGGSKTGSLEDVFIDSISNLPIFECVEKYFNCVKEMQGDIPKQISKAKVHAYLASIVNDPDKRFGESVEAGIWDLNNPAFNLLREFINQL